MKLPKWTAGTCLSWGTCLAALLLSGCKEHHPGHGHEEGAEKGKVIVSRPLKQDTLVTRDFVCQIRSARNIEVRALEKGYLESVNVAEGQAVKEGALMFKVQPLVYQAELKRAEAEAQAARVEYDNTRRLADTKVVSDTELAIVRAKLEKALADVNLAQAHLGFTQLKAPFPGLIDRLHVRKGSLVDEGDLLTTLSDNSEVWVYFNVLERDYLEYASEEQPEERKQVELVMANGKLFDQPGRINAIEAEFNNETGTIPFRADFPNPKALLRHGETGNIRMKKRMPGAVRFYPALNLSAALGLESFTLGSPILAKENLAYGATANLVGPLVNRSALKAAFQGRSAHQVAAVYRYQQTVLKAYTEVVNELSMIRNMAQGYELKSKQAEALVDSVALSNQLFDSARADYTEVLLTQREALDARVDLVEMRQAQLMAAVKAFRALGGGAPAPASGGTPGVPAPSEKPR